MNQAITIAVTGAAGQIGYALIFRLASGAVFGPQTPIHLKLLEIPPALPMLKGVEMELSDCAFPTLASITSSADPEVAFKDCNWALLIGSAPRKAGMERKDLIKINGGIFTTQGKALNSVAASDCRVLVVGNPCNTNALIAMKNCPRLPAENFFAMTMLDQNRARAQLAKRAQCHVSAVKRVCIWGNHSSTQFPDFANGTIDTKPVTTVIDNNSWLRGEFIDNVQQRGAAVIKARGSSSAASAANAALDTVRALSTPTPEGDCFSAAVATTAAQERYGINDELIFGYPLTSDGKKWQVVPKISLDAFAQEKLAATQRELLEEKAAAADFMGNGN